MVLLIFSETQFLVYIDSDLHNWTLTYVKKHFKNHSKHLNLSNYPHGIIFFLP